LARCSNQVGVGSSILSAWPAAIDSAALGFRGSKDSEYMYHWHIVFVILIRKPSCGLGSIRDSLGQISLTITVRIMRCYYLLYSDMRNH
jgi:hypothetical protein